MLKTILKSFGILIDAGFKTYGQMSDEQLKSKAQLFQLVLQEDQRIDDEVIRQTTLRYVRGQVTKNENGADVNVGSDFPTAPEFLHACQQTWNAVYKYVVIGYTTDSIGYQICHAMQVKRSAPAAEVERQIEFHRQRLNLDWQMPELTERSLNQARSLVERTFGADEIID